MAPGKTDNTKLWLCFGTGFALTAASLPFAPEASLILFCLTLYAGFWMMENTRRTHWERSNSFKIRKIEKDGKGFAETLARHEEALASLKKDMNVLERRNDAAKPITLARPLTTKPELRAVKPLHTRSYNDLFNAPAPAANINTSTSAQEDAGYSDAVVSELLDHAIRTNSIEIFAQPVMRLPERQIKYFEMFARLRAKPGTYIPARRFGEAAREVDTLMLLRCLDLIKSAPRPENLPPFFLNIAPQTLKNAAFMRQLLPFAAKNRDLVARLIFEIPFAAFRTLDAPALKVMEGLARLGCTFSLDGIEAPIHPSGIDLEEFMHYRIRSLKIRGAAFLEAREPTAFLRLKSRLEGNGVAVIFDHIESEAQLRKLLEFGPNYGQGHLFGRPDLRGAYMPSLKTKRA
jgi:cyclic-di-GMP phosphodiesterase TipF (flagellum assembly factor)